MSVILATVLALIFILIRDMDTLLNISMLLVYIFNQLTVLALIYMRKTRPNDPRPFKVNLFFPVVFLITCFFLSVMICFIYPYETILCSIFILFGLPVYYMGTKMEKPHSVQSKIDLFTVWIQKLTLSVGESKNK